jgi:MFS family permease
VTLGHASLGKTVFDSLFPLLLSGIALGLPAAVLSAFAHQAQARIAPSSPAVSAVWTLLVAGLIGLIYGMKWPHLVVLAVGGSLFVSGWVSEQRFFRWLFTVLFFGSATFSSSSSTVAARFSVESFPDPMLLLLLISAVAGAALLIRRLPRHTPRVIGAARRGNEPEGSAWIGTIAFALILTVVALFAAAWPWQSTSRATFLAAAPLGACFGSGLALALRYAAELEARYRGLEPRARENLSPFAVAALGAAFLVLVGLEFWLLGPALFLGYIAAAGILIADPSLHLVPPSLAKRQTESPASPNPAAGTR